MTVTALPPMPDPYSGQPHPPPAPLPWDHKVEKRGKRARGLSTPPKGETPVLTWYRYPSTTGPAAGGVTVVIMLIVGAFKDPTFQWVTVWWIWLIPLIFFFGFVVGMRASGFAAGAGWFLSGRKMVRTYELKSITIELVVNRAESLNLVDNAGNHTAERVKTIQGWPPAWDLLYNGILHSVYYNNAVTDERVRDLLEQGGHFELAEYAAARQAQPEQPTE